MVIQWLSFHCPYVCPVNKMPIPGEPSSESVALRAGPRAFADQGGMFSDVFSGLGQDLA